jgi:hypothetical protein
MAFAEDQFFTFKGERTFSMMHIAQHDALNAIRPSFKPYVFSGSQPDADPTAAAAQAAHDVMGHEYTKPEQKTKIDELLAQQLGAIPDGAAKAAGTALGGKSAQAILAARDDDKCFFAGTYEFQKGMGRYQSTPPHKKGFVAQPGFAQAKPFSMKASDQFRPPAPPALESPEYAVAYNEVKEKGAAKSKTRTADETAYAIWWMEFTDGSMNRLARQLIREKGVDLWEAVRLLAYLNMSMYDSYISTWDAKYHFGHWRPYTAIHLAGKDPNKATKPDKKWESLRPAPPFPDYSSAHSTVCASSMAVFAKAFGDETEFTMTTTTAPPDMPKRTFSSFSKAAEECADSRVMIGFHFRYACEAGKKAGREIAEWTMANYLAPRQ